MMRAVTVLLLAAAAAARAGTPIDDFEGKDAPAPWVFGEGHDFPGATGGLSVGEGHEGRGARLEYDFSRGGAYVEARRDLSPPVAAARISFWVKSPPGVRVGMRVIDASGQALAYWLSRPFYALDASAWYRQSVELDAPGLTWGGANDGVLHDPIRQVAILAQEMHVPERKGAIEFDEVEAEEDLPLDPFAATLAPPPPGTERFTEGLGFCLHDLEDERALDAAKEAGFTWIRADLLWDHVETRPGVCDFARHDAFLRRLDARGMHALFILCYGNPLHSDGPGWAPQSEATIAAFAAFAEEAARHFAGRGARLEVWNEPDGFWSPKPDANQFATLAKAALQGIRKGDPHADVAMGGTSSFAYGFIDTALSIAGEGYDAIGVHGYRQARAPESIADDLVALRALVRCHVPQDPPIWLTEWGQVPKDYGNDPHALAIAAVRQVLTSRALGLPLSIYYELTGGMAVLDASHRDLQTMALFRALHHVTEERRFSGILRVEPTSIHALQFDGEKDVVVVVWSEQGNARVRLLCPASATATDLLGGAVALTDHTLELKGSDGPVAIAAQR